jgi:enoyl-CoA hydratase
MVDTNKDDLVDIDIDSTTQIAVLRLNRPDRLNALTADMCDQLVSVLAHLGHDNRVRAIVLTGNGRAFCAGADVRGGSERPLPIYGRYTFFNVLEDQPQPTIAAINGACIGGGFELALCCDLRIAADDAKIGLGEVKLGVIPAGGGTARLPRLVGPAHAKELMFFGDHVSGVRAAELGLVNRAVPAAELVDTAQAWAARLAAGAPLALQAIKRSINVGMQMGLIEAVNYEGQQSISVLHSADATEGMRAFAEKRQPHFAGE